MPDLKISSPCAECAALCCKHEWDVGLTKEELESGKYKVEDGFVGISIAKNPETKHCIYLDEKGCSCSIENIKPETCREFQCVIQFFDGDVDKPASILRENPNLLARILSHMEAHGVTPLELYEQSGY